MVRSDLSSRLRFLREAEKLKDTLRSAYTTRGRTESVAEHTWRLALFAITFADELPGVDLLKMVKMCVLHDLGEAVAGDIPAPCQSSAIAKSENERKDFASLVEPLPDDLKSEFLSLWDEYEGGTSPEARATKALDKLETILQHNQGSNPDNFDYEFNLAYGRAYTDRVPIAARIRDLLDVETKDKAGRRTGRDQAIHASSGRPFPAEIGNTGDQADDAANSRSRITSPLVSEPLMQSQACGPASQRAY